MLFKDSNLILFQLKRTPLSFRTGKQLRSRAETLPSGPAWLCETLKPEGRTKNAVRVFYRQPIECLQSFLSHPLLATHIEFVPRKVWTSAMKICRVYNDWMSGDQAWDTQVRRTTAPDGQLLSAGIARTPRGEYTFGRCAFL